MTGSTRRIESLRLPDASPGTSRQLDFIHYGTPGQGPKAYIQAGLHADEIPGLLVIHKLMHLLDQADVRGEINGSVVLAPIANPIGNGQHFLGELSGRYDHASGINFNRQYADLAAQVGARIGAQLGNDEAQNTRIIRQAALDILQHDSPLDPAAALKLSLTQRAIDADIVLDLHCDWESVLHIYTGTPIWPLMQDLAAYMGVRATLLAEVSGGDPFDEAMSGLWWGLAERFPEWPIANACLAATVELRGKADVSEDQAERDAEAIFFYLQARGVFAGQPPPVPPLEHFATPLDGVEKIVAPLAGVVSYERKPGDIVKPGEVVCVVFDISCYEQQKSRIELTASVEGVLFARRLDRLARPGQTLCRIAGAESLPHAGSNLLSD